MLRASRTRTHPTFANPTLRLAPDVGLLRWRACRTREEAEGITVNRKCFEGSFRRQSLCNPSRGCVARRNAALLQIWKP